MSGIDLRIKKLFKGKKNLVISALDHVLEYGHQPGIEDARKAIKNCLTTDALLYPQIYTQAQLGPIHYHRGTRPSYCTHKLVFFVILSSGLP
jgi:hypothetical protein